MIREDRSKYTHFNAASRWRIWVMDEPGDVVIGIDYLDAPQPNGKWNNVVRLDESAHDFYHAHIHPDMDSRIEIGQELSREKKIKVGFRALADFAQKGMIHCGEETMTTDEVWEGLEAQVMHSQAKKGSTHHNVSITGTARIISSLEAANGASSSD